jgi:hypothetical protein
VNSIGARSDLAQALRMPVIAEDLKTILGLDSVLIVSGGDSVWAVLWILNDLVLLQEREKEIRATV